jgi:integrase
MGQPTKFRFTTRAVASLLAHDANSPSKCAEYTDTQVPGLKCQVTKLGRKAFFYRYTHRAIKRAIKLGEFPATGVDEARSRALDIRSALDRGEDPQAERIRLIKTPTFAAFAMDEYMPYAVQHKRSAEDDEAKLRLYMIPAFGKLLLCDVTTRDIQMYLGNLRQKLSPATANRHLALFSKLFKLGVAWGRIDKNPCVGIDKFKEAGAKQRYLSPDEVRRVMAAALQEANIYASAAIRFLLLTGIRREECLTARWEHVDLEQRTLFLPHTKNGRSRTVFLNDAAAQLLASLPHINGSPWVFPGRDPAKPLNNPRKAFHRILDAAGVEHCRLHDCRHTHASLLVNQGASLYQVQQLLGHASPQTTQRYSHLAAQTLRDTSQLVSRIVTADSQQ